MNLWALTALVTIGLFAVSVLIAVASHVVGEVLDRRQRALLVAVSYAAGFCTAVVAFFLRS